MVKRKIKRKPTASYWKSKRRVRRHIFHRSHPGSCAVSQEDTLAPKEVDDVEELDSSDEEFGSEEGQAVGMLRSLHSSQPSAVPKLSLTGLRSSLQGSALMGLPPPEEPGVGLNHRGSQFVCFWSGGAKLGRCMVQSMFWLKYGKLLGCKVVRSMFVVLLTLALWPCDAVKDEKVGMVDALCNAVKVPMLCNDKQQQLSDACQTNPQSCCKESTCAAMPGMGCWKRRGDTQCEGDSVFPPKIGSCQCLSGYCGSDGKCSVTMGFHGQASNSGYTAFGRLYEDSDEPIPPELALAGGDCGHLGPRLLFIAHQLREALMMSCLKLSLISGLAAAVLLLTIDDLEQAVRLGGRFVTRRTRRLAESKVGNETDKMGQSQSGGNVSNAVSNATESPWPEDYFPEIFATDFKTRNALPFVHYNGCRHCAEHAFCNYASNPGCGGSAANGVVTFRNIRYAHGCRVKPVLSIPRSYIRDLEPWPSDVWTLKGLPALGHADARVQREAT
eukprot:s983_g16.t1